MAENDAMTQRAHFHLVYDGSALAEHRMDVRALAPALLAMGDLVDRANELLNGDQARMVLNVRASFKEGSFGIDLESVQSLWNQLLDLAGSPKVAGVKAVLEWLGLTGSAGLGVVKLIKRLRGRGIRKIEAISNGKVMLYVDGEQLEVEEQVLKLLRDYRLRKALQDVVAEPLRREGIETVAIVDAKLKRVNVVIERSEAHLFIAPDPQDELVSDETYVATLQVLTLAFQDGNKWRFTEGANSYFATVLDDGFLHRIQSNQEQFAKDDIIRARVRRTQRLTKEGLKAEYEVIEVLEHRSATPHIQIKMDFPAGES